MRNLMVVLFAALFIICFPVSAQEQAPKTENVQALSPEDAKEAKEQLESLAVAFGVKAPPAAQVATTPVPANTQTEHKTLGDAADKALDLVSKAVGSISATLEKVAPNIWRIMIKQQYAKAIGDVITPSGLFFLVLLYWRIIKKVWTTEDITEGSDEYWIRTWLVRIIPFVLSFAFAATVFWRLSESVKYLINPEYYAVRDIVSMLLGQSPMR